MFKRLIAGLAGTSTLFLPAAAFAQQVQRPTDWSHGHHMWGGGSMWGPGLFGPFFMLLFLALVVGITVFAVRWLSGPGSHYIGPRSPETPSPVDVLKQRFARGEIDTAEYEERLKLLQG